MICKNCGMENPDTAKFCTGCGAKLEQEPLKCPSCGAVLEGKSAFCSSCGHKLGEPAPAAKEEPVAQEPVQEAKPAPAVVPAKPQQAAPKQEEHSKFSKVMDIIMKAFMILTFTFTLVTIAGGAITTKYINTAYSNTTNYGFSYLVNLLSDSDSVTIGTLISLIFNVVVWVVAAILTIILTIVGIIKTAKSFKQVGVASAGQLAGIAFVQLLFCTLMHFTLGSESVHEYADRTEAVRTAAGWGMSLLLVMLIILSVLACVNGIIGGATEKKNVGPAILRTIIFLIVVFFPFMIIRSFYGIKYSTGDKYVKSAQSLLLFVNNAHFDGATSGMAAAYFLAIGAFLFQFVSVFFVIGAFTKTFKRLVNPAANSGKPAPFLLTTIFTTISYLLGFSAMSTYAEEFSGYKPYVAVGPIILIIFGIAGFVLSIIENKKYQAMNAPAK